MLSFEKFLVIINYLTNRLQNHSIYVSSKHQGGIMKEAPQFLAFIDDIDCKEDEIEYVLNILSCGDNTNSKDTGIFFVKIGKELTIQTKTQRNCYLLETINDNLRLFNENKDKKIELSKILNNQNEMCKLLIEDIEKSSILNELLKENRKFGMIQGVSNAIYNVKSPVNKELAPITTETKNYSKIPSKDAIRNEYELHYTEHPVDYKNKEELEIEIYNKLKPNYPTLSKTIIQKIGKEVRKERNMNGKGRPQGRGNVISNK